MGGVWILVLLTSASADMIMQIIEMKGYWIAIEDVLNVFVKDLGRKRRIYDRRNRNTG